MYFRAMKKVLVTDYVHPSLIEGLEAMSYTVQYDQNFPPDQLNQILPELHGIVINTKSKMTAERIGLGSNLEFIARLGSGLDIIDLEAAAKRGIKVINTPEGNCDAVAEHAIGMLLSLNNNLRLSDKEVRQGQWSREKNRGVELGQKTLGIVGLGNTGRALARKLSNWGLEMLYYDPYVYDVPGDLAHIQRVEWAELISKSDVISLHVQLTEETKHMVASDFFENCKNELVLINTSRGAVVKTIDLVEALEQGKIRGACLDVFENEKPQTFTDIEKEIYGRLYKMENVLLSPHVAGWTHESLKRIADVMLNKLKS